MYTFAWLCVNSFNLPLNVLQVMNSGVLYPAAVVEKIVIWFLRFRRRKRTHTKIRRNGYQSCPKCVALLFPGIGHFSSSFLLVAVTRLHIVGGYLPPPYYSLARLVPCVIVMDLPPPPPRNWRRGHNKLLPSRATTSVSHWVWYLYVCSCRPTDVNTYLFRSTRNPGEI